jgi:hypothetical protein
LRLRLLLLLLKTWTVTARTRRSANAQRILAIGQTDTATFDQTTQSASVQIIQGFCGKADVFKFDETHWAVDLLTETQLSEPGASLEELAKTVLEVVGRIAGRDRRSGQIANVECINGWILVNEIPRACRTRARNGRGKLGRVVPVVGGDG